MVKLTYVKRFSPLAFRTPAVLATFELLFLAFLFPVQAYDHMTYLG